MKFLTPDELSEFMEGKRGNFLAISYGKVSDGLSLQRLSTDSFEVIVPCMARNEDSDFNLLAALPTCGAQFELIGSQIRIMMRTRAQIRAVIKLTSNHLGWKDPDSICFDFRGG